jgi:hypothetical protein
MKKRKYTVKLQKAKKNLTIDGVKVKRGQTLLIKLPEFDSVNHPHHYNNSGANCPCGRQIECIDVTRHMSFNLGNAMKYLWRFKDRNGLEDLKKARWYLDDEIKKMESKA